LAKKAENNILASKRPIGIFDSGIGGLTIAHALSIAMPGESLIYFGDTAHLPYGDKSPDSIKYYSIRIAQLLLEKNCKMIVIACNTASALAYETVKDFVGNKALVVNVIDPLVQTVLANKKLKHIGVIGTKGTVKSDIYAKKLKAKKSSLQVSSLATPLLASMIEEGFFNNKISKTIIHDYLSRPKLKGVDALLLACTHYPLIRPEIESFYGGSTIVWDSAEVVANYVSKVLKSKKIASPQKTASHHFYVSDFTQSFEKSTKFFFTKKIKLEEISLWK